LILTITDWPSIYQDFDTSLQQSLRFMSKNKVYLASIFIAFGAIFRLIPHPVNVSPVAAMALIGGMYIGKKHLAYLIPLAALFFSDLILNNTINRGFFQNHTGLVILADYMIYTYGAYILTVLSGFLIRKTPLAGKILFGIIITSLLFFVVTNIGVWASGILYPKTAAGLSASFAAALPFFRNTILSNVVFVTLFVLLIELITNNRSITKATA